VEPSGPTTAELLLRVDKEAFDIPIVFNEEVIEWIEWFMGPGRGTMGRWIERSGRYQRFIQAELIQAKMPTDILYLAMIESGFSPTARSHAEAVGVWQFIKPTALHYGLRVDELIDQRKDTVAATQSAIAYLKKLKLDFGNWYMAFAAYNAGEGLVFSAVRAHGTIDYWGLSRVGALPEETRNYVPKILAAATIAKNRQLFGFQGRSPLPPLVFDPISVNGGTSVEDMAQCAQMEEEDFRKLNPQILGDALPEEPEKQTIYLPQAMQRDFLIELRAIQQRRRAPQTYLDPIDPEPPIDLSHHARSLLHTVQEDDSLESIAKWYRIKESDLRQWNDLAEDEAPSPGQQLRTAAPRAQRWVSYTPQPGESLNAIARKHTCSVDELRSWNGLEDDATHPEAGTVLWIDAQ
jgi:membrane-bound lytic murein transglycosylase D